jgi:hypothetical protein
VLNQVVGFHDVQHNQLRAELAGQERSALDGALRVRGEVGGAKHPLVAI